ncbi:MAG TPA: hypothetical protein VMW50_02565 [Dehalococcoidia bacterium]|jgi:hypothetical protein|nr:hypothetical protein [Dehalococcoidia bacterium]
MKYARLLLALLFVSPLVFAIGEKTFTFTPPTQYEDGTALPQSKIASYDIVCDGALLVNFPNVPQNTDTYQAAPGTFATGTHVCVAHTVTTEGVRSQPSNSANFTVEPGVPSAPINFVVQ